MATVTEARYTYGDTFTGFKKVLHDSIMLNELRNGRGAYQLSWAKTDLSGLSYGPQQFDLASSNPDAQPVLRRILESATYDTGPNAGQRIVDDKLTEQLFGAGSPLLMKGTDTFLTAPEWRQARDLVTAAINSSYGRNTVDSAYDVYLDRRITDVTNKIENNITNPDSKAFLQNSVLAQVLIGNLMVQFSPTTVDAYFRFLNGEDVQIDKWLGTGANPGGTLTTKGTQNLSGADRAA